MPTAWTPEMEARLRKLWGDGLVLSEVAMILGCEFRTPLTRNSIAGKARRLGLPYRQSREQTLKMLHGRRFSDKLKKKQGEAKKVKAATKREIMRKLPEEPRPQERIIDPHEDNWLRKCQWIEGDPGPRDDCKCGARVLIGTPYCPEHHEMSVDRKRVARGVKLL